MKSQESIFEKSRSVEDVHHLRLMALLRELVRDKGVMKATEALGVDYRTLVGSLKDGRLSRRMRHVLEKALLEGGGSPAAEQRERNDALEGRLEEWESKGEALAKDVSKGLAAVRGDVKALRDEQAQAMRQLERRVAALEGGQGRSGRRGRRRTWRAGRRRGGAAPWREYPDLLTLEPAESDEEVFGDAWPLIVEWRALKNAHPVRGKGFEWLTDHKRLLEMELALLEEHGMTLPPEKQPLRGFDRNGQINWRRTALSGTRRAWFWRWRVRQVLRAVTFRLWRR